MLDNLLAEFRRQDRELVVLRKLAAGVRRTGRATSTAELFNRIQAQVSIAEAWACHFPQDPHDSKTD